MLPVVRGVRRLIATFHTDDAIRGFNPVQQAILAHVLCIVVTSSASQCSEQPDYVSAVRDACTSFLDTLHSIAESSSSGSMPDENDMRVFKCVGCLETLLTVVKQSIHQKILCVLF